MNDKQVQFVRVKPTARVVQETITLSPKEVAEYGMKKWERHPLMRLLNASFHATTAATGKTHWRPRHVVLRIVGRHGVGKTAVIEQYARDEGVGYVKLDSAVTDVAEIFGLKDTHRIEGKSVTVSALPEWWPKVGTTGIINVDDFTRAQPHVLQAMMQFIMEREFNGTKLPDGWAIVISDNPDNGDYAVNSLDPAQLTRMITVAFNPDDSVEYEQLVVQDVHDDLKSFWMAKPDLIRVEPILVEPTPEFNNPRMRMLFNRIYPYVKYDDAVLNLVGTSMFGPAFIASLKGYLASEQPISPKDIFDDVPYRDKLERWSTSGRQDLIGMSVRWLVQDLRLKEVLKPGDFQKISAFLKEVPINNGAVLMTEAAKPGGTLYNLVGANLHRDVELLDRYSRYIGKLKDELDPAHDPA